MTQPTDNRVATQPKRRTGKVRAVQAEIIERRLAGEPIRAIQADLAARGIKLTADTIIDVYDEHLAIAAQQRPQSVAQLTEEAIERAEWAVIEARTAWEASKRQWIKVDGTDVEVDAPGDPRLLAEYRQACAQLAKLRGLEAVKVEHSGSVEIAGAKAALAAAFEALAETTAPEDDADAEGEGET